MAQSSTMKNIIEDNWHCILSMLPENWEDLAYETKAVTKLVGIPSVENLLRILMIYIATGVSFRTTSAQAKAANLGNMSDVAIMKRLRKSKKWFHNMCLSLFQNEEISNISDRFSTLNIKIADSSIIKEPGKSGSQWRLHYLLSIPNLLCVFFSLKPSKGEGTGDSLLHYPVNKNDCFLVDRAYVTAHGIDYINSKDAFIVGRVKPRGLPLLLNGKKNPLC